MSAVHAQAGINYRRDQRPRADEDFYVEPAWSVEALLDAESFIGDVYDPACGTGNIVDVCRARGLDTWGSDLVDRANGRFGPGGLDFLTISLSSGRKKLAGSIICNPPFKNAENFIRRGIEVTDRKVAMLVRLAFLEGQKRRAMFEALPLSRVLVFSRRVSMPPGGLGIEAKGGSVAFCWIVFEHGHRGPATIGWLG